MKYRGQLYTLKNLSDESLTKVQKKTARIKRLITIGIALNTQATIIATCPVVAIRQMLTSANTRSASMILLIIARFFLAFNSLIAESIITSIMIRINTSRSIICVAFRLKL